MEDKQNKIHFSDLDFTLKIGIIGGFMYSLVVCVLITYVLVLSFGAI